MQDSWSKREMYLMGTTGGAAGRAYRNRVSAALFIGLLIAILGRVFQSTIPALALVVQIAPGIVFGWIGWQFYRYVNQVDELERRIHMEAMAWTYLAGLLVAVALGGWLGPKGGVSPTWFVLLEPVRAALVARIAKQYQ